MQNETTDRIAPLLADPADFRAWLERQSEVTSFRANTSYTCPLACYLTDQLALGPASVGVGSTLAFVGDAYVGLPAWAHRFAYEVDLYGEDARISRDQALGALAWVTTHA